MRPRSFFDSDRIAVLSFLEKFKDTCNPSHVAESIPVQYFQFYMEEQAESLLLTLLTGSSVAVESKRSIVLRTCVDVVNFVLRAYATTSFTAKAYTDVVSLSRGSAMAEEIYSRMLWDIALPC